MKQMLREILYQQVDLKIMKLVVVEIRALFILLKFIIIPHCRS